MGDQFFGIAEKFQQLQAGQLSPDEASGFIAFLRANRESMDDDVKAYLAKLDEEAPTRMATQSSGDPGEVFNAPPADPAPSGDVGGTLAAGESVFNVQGPQPDPPPGPAGTPVWNSSFPRAPNPDPVDVDPPAVDPTTDPGLFPDADTGSLLGDLGTAQPPPAGVEALDAPAEPDPDAPPFQTPATGPTPTLTVQDQGQGPDGAGTVELAPMPAAAMSVAVPPASDPTAPPDVDPLSLDPVPATDGAPSEAVTVVSRGGHWWSPVLDPDDGARFFGCLFGLVLILALLVVAVAQVYSHTFGAPAANTAANSAAAGSTSLLIGSPVTGSSVYTERIGSETFTRTETTILSGNVLSVDAQVTGGAGATGQSCIDYRKGVSPTQVAMTEQIVHLCGGGGTSVTTTCDPAFPLFISSLVMNQPRSFSSTCSTPSTSPTSTSQTYTETGSITLLRVIRLGGRTYVVVRRQYSRTFSSSTAASLSIQETSVYRIDRWQEIGTTTLSALGSSTSSSQFALQGAPPAILALLPGPTASVGGPSGGGSSNTGGPFVIIAFNELSYTGLNESTGTGYQPVSTICQSGGLLHLGVTINGIAAGTPVVVHVTGTYLQQTLTFTANPGVEYMTQFRIPGGNQGYSDTILSIGGKAPPSSGAHVAGQWQCTT